MQTELSLLNSLDIFTNEGVGVLTQKTGQPFGTSFTLGQWVLSSGAFLVAQRERGKVNPDKISSRFGSRRRRNTLAHSTLRVRFIRTRVLLRFTR